LNILSRKIEFGNPGTDEKPRKIEFGNPGTDEKPGDRRDVSC
jgi:hypothetical protein